MEIEKEILNEGSWATILNNPETQQGEAADYAPDTAPQDRQVEGVCPERDGGQTVAAVREEQTKEPFLVVRYNHENQNLSLEEAKIAAQKGIRFSSISEKLDRLAAIKQTSVEALIDSMLQNERDTYKSGLTEQFGENSDTIERLMRLYDIEQENLYRDAEAQREEELKTEEINLKNRLGEEFTALREEFPSLTNYESLPFEVRDFAENGKDLMFAYLLYRYNEEKRIAEAEKAAKAAAEASAGSLVGLSVNEGSDINAFKSGLWR